MSDVREMTIDCWTIQLDNGENLKDLALGNAVDLSNCPGYDGLWISAGFHGDFNDTITLQAAAVTTNCAEDPAIACKYSGNPHPHPVDNDGRLQPLPAGA